MGKIIAVWSDVKNAGKSVTTYILANQLRDMGRKDLKILVCCLNLKYSLLYKLFRVDVSAVGLEELVNYQFIENNNLDIMQSIIPQNNGIYFLGSYHTTNSFAQKNINSYCKLFEQLQENFDLIIFDTVSGKENVLTNMVLQKANVVLNLFVQDEESMKELSHIEDEQTPYNQEILYLVTKYRSIYPRLNDIKRRYSLKKVYTLNYCETLQEMKNRDSLHLYLQRETSCNESVGCVARHVLEAFGLMPPDNTVGEKPGNYMKSLINSIFIHD